MQLKFKRFVNVKRGMLSSKQTYCLEAMLLAAPEEAERINEFDRWSDYVWLSGDLDLDSDDEEFKRQIMKISMRDLAQGSRFEYPNFNSVLRTENIIASACKQLLATVNCLATFDGTERVVQVDEESAEVIAAG